MNEEITTKAEDKRDELREDGLLPTKQWGSCPICADSIEADGSCFYCDFKSDWTPVRIAEAYNLYWSKGHCKAGYEREPKTAKDFVIKNKVGRFSLMLF